MTSAKYQNLLKKLLNITTIRRKYTKILGINYIHVPSYTKLLVLLDYWQILLANKNEWNIENVGLSPEP